MNEEQFQTLMAQVMAKLDEGPGSHTEALRQLAQKYTAIKELTPIISSINESLQLVRLAMKYMAFDLEATRRERDLLRTILEDQSD